MNLVGEIRYANRIIPVYNDLDKPLFLAQDIIDLAGYNNRHNNLHNILSNIVEHDEKLKLPIIISGQTRHMWFLTEMGLYNLLSQSRLELARAWRRIVHHQLIDMRREKGLNVVEQFDEWNHELDDIYFDDQGRIWQSKTVAGGDVEQICLSEEA